MTELTPEQRAEANRMAQDAISRGRMPNGREASYICNALLDLAHTSEAQAAKIIAISEQLEHDRSLVADCIIAAEKAIDGRYWLTEGRGCYEWDDDKWHDEFRAAAVEMLDSLKPLHKVAANWKDCPQTSAEVATARIDLKAKVEAQAKRIEELERENKTFHERYVTRTAYDAIKGEIDRLRKALEQIVSEAGIHEKCSGYREGFLDGLERAACIARAALSAAPPLRSVPLPPRASHPVPPPHDTIPVRCVVDVDKNIAPLIDYLNTIPGVRTFSSCEGGLSYGPQVMVSWLDRTGFDFLAMNYPLINIETGESVEFGRESVAYIARREERCLQRFGE